MIWTTLRSCLLVLIGFWVQWKQKTQSPRWQKLLVLMVHYVPSSYWHHQCLSLLSVGCICKYIKWMFPRLQLKAKSKSHRESLFTGEKHWWLTMTFFPRYIPESAALVTEICLVLGKTVWVNNIGPTFSGSGLYYADLKSVWSMD